jgi:hypothetical protein
MEKFEKFINAFNLLLIAGLNNKTQKKFQHHILLFGMDITDNNADHPQ